MQEESALVDNSRSVGISVNTLPRVAVEDKASGFRVQGSGFRVLGFGFWVETTGFHNETSLLVA